MSRRINAWLPWLIALLAVAARLLPTPRTIDDAFITFRYARNLLGGLGFVYNAGERVLGTTTPLYTLLMAGLAGLTGSRDFPWLALWTNALADAATCLLLVALGYTLTGKRHVGLGAALLWAIAPMSVTFAIGGMETSVFIFLLVLTSYLYVIGATRLAAIAGGLVVLTRPDGLLLVAPLILDLVVRRLRQRQFPWGEAALFAATVAPWALFATLYFGSPVPQSIAAKIAVYRLVPEAALVRLMQHYGTPFFEHEVLGRFWPLAGLMLYLALSVLAGVSLVRRNGRTWPVVAFPWLYAAAYSLANPLIFRWYLAPPLPFYFLLILAGLQRVAEDAAAVAARKAPPARPRSEAKRVPLGEGGPGGLGLRALETGESQIAEGDKRARIAPPSARAVVGAATALFALLSLNAWSLQPDHGPARPAPDMAWHLLELYYTQVGRSLNSRTAGLATVAAGDVGALGYYSGARILDTVGLVSPEAARYYPLDSAVYVINYAIAPDLILDARPDYVVMLEAYGRAGLLKDPRFLSAYTLDEKIDTDIYGSDGLLVYRRAP
jgi:hypothetical protein